MSTGVATQDLVRQHALVVSDKAERVFHYHANTIQMLAEMMGAAGLSHPSQTSADLLMTQDLNGRAIQFFSKETTLAEGILLGTPEFIELLPKLFATHSQKASETWFGRERLARKPQDCMHKFPNAILGA
jgi:hypothetical protein